MNNIETLEIEASHRSALLARIREMKRSMWTRAEIATAVAEWPADWQALVRGRW